MRIPKVIEKDGFVYIYEKEYPNFILYKNLKTGLKECFKLIDLVEIKGERVIRTRWERQADKM